MVTMLSFDMLVVVDLKLSLDLKFFLYIKIKEKDLKNFSSLFSMSLVSLGKPLTNMQKCNNPRTLIKQERKKRHREALEMANRRSYLDLV